MSDERRVTSDECSGQDARCPSGVINRDGSYQQAPAPSQKKAEGKKRKSPCTPFREKAKGKESDRRVLSRNRLSRADARTVARAGCAPCPGLGRLVAAALDADLDTAVEAFHGTAEDRRIWAAVAWRVGVEEFHFALMDKLAEDRADGPARKPAAAFQAFLNERFPKAEATGVSLPRGAGNRGSGALAASSRAEGGAA